jgi:general secretion pathway protein I
VCAAKPLLRIVRPRHSRIHAHQPLLRIVRPRHSRIHAHHGFTLIEVMVALVVIALGMIGVIQAVSQTASNSGYLRDKTVAHWVAMNQLTAVRLQKAAPGVDKSSDEVEMAGRSWKWTMEVTQTPVETIRRIDISVRPADAKDGSSLASVTGFYGTAVAPPGSTLVAWQGAGDGDGPPGRQADEDDDEQQPPQNEPPGEEDPPERDDEPITDPSDPTQEQ